MYLLFLFTLNVATFDSTISLTAGALNGLHNSSLMMLAAVLLCLMLRPVSMCSQYPVQKFLRDRLAPSLLRRYSRSVNQGLPFILQHILIRLDFYLKGRNRLPEHVEEKGNHLQIHVSSVIGILKCTKLNIPPPAKEEAHC